MSEQLLVVDNLNSRASSKLLMSTSSCEQSLDDSELLCINVGGIKYTFLVANLLRFDANFDGGLLGRFAGMRHEQRMTIAHAYIRQCGEYYFDRSPLVAAAVLDFHYSGELLFFNSYTNVEFV
jgi:hypothetical protein